MLGMEPHSVNWTMDFSIGSISVSLGKEKLKTRNLWLCHSPPSVITLMLSVPFPDVS